MSAITALTAQNTRGVQRHSPGAAGVCRRADCGGAGRHRRGRGQNRDALLGRIDPRGRGRSCNNSDARNIVLDPVMVAQSGDRLLRDDAVGAITEYLMPLADVVTPNIPEAEVLVGRARPHASTDMQAAARDLARHGSRSILIKGGHREEDDSTRPALPVPGRSVGDADRPSASARRNNHGTGCTLSSAIAAYLARGRGARRRRAPGQGIHQPRHPRRRGLYRWAEAMGRCTIFSRRGLGSGRAAGFEGAKVQVFKAERTSQSAFVLLPERRKIAPPAEHRTLNRRTLVLQNR